MLASQRGHANIAKRLIDAGSDVNQQTVEYEALNVFEKVSSALCRDKEARLSS